MTRETRGCNQNPSAGAVVANIGRKRQESYRIIPRGVDGDERYAGDKVLPDRTHPQLDSLRGGVAIHPADHLFDLHQVKRGLSWKRERHQGERDKNPHSMNARIKKAGCVHRVPSVGLAASRQAPTQAYEP